MYIQDDILVKTEIEDALRLYVESEEGLSQIRLQHKCMRQTMDNVLQFTGKSNTTEMKEIAETYTMEKFCVRVTEILQAKAEIDSGFAYRLLIYSKYPKQNSEKKVNLIQYLFTAASEVAMELLKDFTSKTSVESDYFNSEDTLFMAMMLQNKEQNISDRNLFMAMMLGGWSTNINNFMIMHKLAENN